MVLVSQRPATRISSLAPTARHSTVVLLLAVYLLAAGHLLSAVVGAAMGKKIGELVADTALRPSR